MNLSLNSIVFVLLISATSLFNTNNLSEFQKQKAHQFDTIPESSDTSFDESTWIIDYVEIQASIIQKTWKRYLKLELHKAIKDSSFKKLPAGKYVLLIKFQIDKDGNIKDVQAITNSPIELIRPCIELIQNGPKWQPAVLRGKPSESYVTQPITFIISRDECNTINCAF